MGTLRTRIAGQPVVLERTVKSFMDHPGYFVTWWASANVNDNYGLGIDTDVTKRDEVEAITWLEWCVVTEMVQRDFNGHAPSNGGMVKPPAYYDVIHADPTEETIRGLEGYLNDLYGDWRAYVVSNRDRYDG